MIGLRGFLGRRRAWGRSVVAVTWWWAGGGLVAMRGWWSWGRSILVVSWRRARWGLVAMRWRWSWWRCIVLMCWWSAGGGLVGMRGRRANGGSVVIVRWRRSRRSVVGYARGGRPRWRLILRLRRRMYKRGVWVIRAEARLRWRWPGGRFVGRRCAHSFRSGCRSVRDRTGIGSVFCLVDPVILPFVGAAETH